MRILLSCLQSQVAYPLPAYKYWETYFTGGITEAGHEWSAVPDVDWAEGLLYAGDEAAAAMWRDRTWTRVVSAVTNAPPRARPDMFLSYLYPWMVDAGGVRALQSLGVPCVNYFCDNVREFVAVPEEYRPFDLHWVPELAATAFYARARMPYIHAAMPAWILPELRRWDHPERYGVMFIGSRDPLREVLLADAIARGAPIELRGPGWPTGDQRVRPPTVAERAPRNAGAVVANQVRFIKRYGLVALARKAAERFRRGVDDAILAPHVAPTLDAGGYVEKTQGGKIIIGVNRYPSFRHPFRRPDTYSRSRDIEAPMMGACYLTEWTPELATMYEIGTEIETYRDAQELTDKIRELDRDPARRRKMRRDAQRRALTDHSVPRTLDRVAERLQLRPSSV